MIVDFYEQVGYLPDAIINYLVLLGWSLDERTEFFTREQMIDNFSLERVNQAPASFDPKKLWSFQDHYMQELPVDEKAAHDAAVPGEGGRGHGAGLGGRAARLRQVIAAAGDRLKVAGDILDFADSFCPTNSCRYDEAAFEKQLRDDETAARLGAIPRSTGRGRVIRRRGGRASSAEVPGRRANRRRQDHPRHPRGGDRQNRRLRPVRNAGHAWAAKLARPASIEPWPGGAGS